MIKNIFKKSFCNLKNNFVLLTEYKKDPIELKKYNNYNLYKCYFELSVSSLLMYNKHFIISGLICYLASTSISKYFITKKVLNCNVNKILLNKENLQIEIFLGIYKLKKIKAKIEEINLISNIKEIENKLNLLFINEIDEEIFINFEVIDLQTNNKELISLIIDKENNISIDHKLLIMILKRDLNRIKLDN